MALNDLACRNAKPRDKEYKLGDSGRLYLLVRPNGSKLWRLNYAFAGKQKTRALGAYPAIGLAEARRLRDEAKDLLANGVDPSAAQEVAEERTFKGVTKEWFDARKAGWVPSYSDRVWSRLSDDVLPELGDKDVAKISPAEVLTVLRKVEDRGALEMAKRLRQHVSAIFQYAVASSLATSDPASPLKKAMKTGRRTKHRNALKEGDLPGFFVNLRNYDGEEVTALGLELVAHIFVRTQEIRFAKWDEFGGDTWRIPEERMKMKKEHLVPLSPYVRGLLDRLKDAGGGSEWVLPGDVPGQPVSENTLLFALYRMGYHKRATVHGFRTVASTALNESQLWRWDAIERQLAHVPEDEVRDAYNAALYLDERTRMMDWYSNFLLAKAGQIAPAKPRRPELDLSNLLD